MQLLPSCKALTHWRSKRLVTDVIASSSISSSQPPVANSLDRVLKKASNKVNLAHPVAQSTQQKKPKDAAKRPALRAAASRTTSRAQQKQRHTPEGVDDDALFNSITERERDSVWEALKLELEAGSDSDAGWPDAGTSGRSALPPKRRSAPASARNEHGPPIPTITPPHSALPLSQPIASSSGFKGFGTPPPTRRPESPASPSSASPASKGLGSLPAASPSPSRHQQHQPQHQETHTQRGAGQRPAASSSSSSLKGACAPLRVFLFNAEVARTRELLGELGLAGRVEVVDELRSADAIVAAKLARSGKHVNLTQGERTAANMGIPFLVVGRNMSADNLRATIMPLVDPQAAPAAAASTVRAPTAAELHAFRMEVALGFAQMMRREGGVGAVGGWEATAAVPETWETAIGLRSGTGLERRGGGGDAS